MSKMQQNYYNIRQKGKMSTPSKTQLKNMIKKYLQDFIHDSEIEQTRDGRLSRIGIQV